MLLGIVSSAHAQAPPEGFPPPGYALKRLAPSLDLAYRDETPVSAPTTAALLDELERTRTGSALFASLGRVYERAIPGDRHGKFAITIHRTFDGGALESGGRLDPDVPFNDGLLRPIELVSTNAEIVVDGSTRRISPSTVDLAHELLHAAWIGPTSRTFKRELGRVVKPVSEAVGTATYIR